MVSEPISRRVVGDYRELFFVDLESPASFTIEHSPIPPLYSILHSDRSGRSEKVECPRLPTPFPLAKLHWTIL